MTNPGPILLVEDNPDDVTFTLRAFSRHDFANEIVVARDGEQALRLLLPEDGSPPLRPALMLLDVKLPKLGGLELLRVIRADPRTRVLPVVVLTTSSEERDIADSYRLGANSFVRKPVSFTEFLGAAKALWIYWLCVNEAPPPWRGAHPGGRDLS